MLYLTFSMRLHYHRVINIGRWIYEYYQFASTNKAICNNMQPSPMTFDAKLRKITPRENG